MKKMISLIIVALSLFLVSCSLRMTPERTELLVFQHSPFPYDGAIPDTDKLFFDVCEQDGRRGHTSARGGVYWEEKVYADRRVMLAIPSQFSIEQQPVIIVYLHGNESTLERDVRDRQQLPEQLSQSGLNAILVAPQLAFDAKDSSAGHFWDDGFFAKFLEELAVQTANLQNDSRYRRVIEQAPVVVVAYSGGYQAAAFLLDRGGAEQRIKGVMLLDALYGQEEKFSGWISRNHDRAFFFSAYTEPARAGNEHLQQMLYEAGLRAEQTLPDVFLPGQITVMPLDASVVHRDLLTQAWTANSFADLLRKCNYLRR